MKTYNRADLNSNMECPYHKGKTMFANGCGGKGMKFVNKMLGLLPSSKLFYGPCCLHDITYALVSVKPIRVKYPNDQIVILRNRRDCDDLWLKEMLEMCEKTKWFRGVMLWAAKRNYKLVRENGDKFFKHEH